MTGWHQMSERDIFQALNSSAEGLAEAEAARRLAENGGNVLAEGKRKTLIGIFFTQFTDLMIWVLMAAGVISGVLGEWTDASIILIVVFLNAIMGTVQESKAEAALDALRNMAAPRSKVKRGGSVNIIPAGELVAGDMIILDAGDAVPADARLLECSSLKAEESALTGESVPSDKAAVMLEDPDAPVGDRLNMVFMGTSVSYGRASAIVVETGMKTQIGAIAGQLAQAKKELTPLQRVLNRISNLLSIGVLCIAGVIFVINMLAFGGHNPFESFMLAVSLAVAAIPEGMVAVVTIVLAMGMRRMAGQGAIIRRLPAVETLGSTQVICSDKTGTLTLNRMTVTKVWAADEELLFDAMCHNNDVVQNNEGQLLGDPTETALVHYILQGGHKTEQDLQRRRRAGDIPFDSERKLSTVAVRHGNGLRIYVKGAPDVLLGRCTIRSSDALEAENQNTAMASEALRVLAFAYKDVPGSVFTADGSAERDLTFIGLCGMIDPARPEARNAIATCKKAGIRAVMITGDHKVTAVAIARDLGILTKDDQREAVTGSEIAAMSDEELCNRVTSIGVYARVAPEHKSRIVAAWQKRGCIVSMTGDGVNDAPALKAADIGVAMGISGTDVSRGASDMVLTDDNFATIVFAVKEGRRIFDNIHKTVRFLLSSNAGEVISVLVSTLLGWVLLRPTHILWINLVTDTFPALALGMEPAEGDIMERPPRDAKRPFFTGREWFRIGLVGLVEASLAICAYMLGGVGTELGTTMAFLTLSLSQLFAALGFQSERNSVFHITGKHRFLWIGFAGSVLLQLVVVLVAPLREIFSLVMPGWLQWVQVAALCLVMLLFVELQKVVARWRDG